MGWGVGGVGGGHNIFLIGEIMNGWMICNFTSLVLQSYQDGGQTIMKGCVQWCPIYGREDFASSGAQTQNH